MARFEVGDWVVIVDNRPEMNGKYDGLICKIKNIIGKDYNLENAKLMGAIVWSEEFLVPASEVIKVGSRLKIREDLSSNMCPMPLYSVNVFMEKLKGKIVTVDCFSKRLDGNMEITLKNNEWCWSLGMFKRVIDYKVENNMEEKEMEEKIVLTEEQKEKLVEEMSELLDEYDYSYSDSAINKIINEWFKAKEPIIRILSKHPNWKPEKFQVQFNHTFNRVLDEKARRKFFSWIECRDLLKEILQPYKINNRTLGQAEDDLYGVKIPPVTYRCGYAINGEQYLAATAERIKLRAEISAFDKRRYTEESENKFYKGTSIIEVLKEECTEQYISQEIADKLNAIDSELRVHRGHKTTKIVGKFCRMYGIDKADNYGREYAKYCDAMNPLEIKRHTILSLNPIDYLTMSFGNTWSSCHTIDKENNRQRGGRSYQGCYSSGTMSYMLDETSMVFYTVSADYDGEDFELEDKVSRNMFHFGKEKLIQGRIYPFDQTDDNHSCGNEIYKPYREIVQKIFADCLEVPNLWYNKKGTSECDSVTYHKGTHYRDTSHYGNCNVSYIRKTPSGVDFNNADICIGAKPICITCGEKHSVEDNISCCDTGERCACCGEIISQRDFGSDCVRDTAQGWCCDDDNCAIWCDYHNCYEVREDDHEYVSGYGWICDAGIDYANNISRCEDCGSVFRIDDGIFDAYGDFYCYRCAKEDLVYVETEGEYYPVDETARCAGCGEYFLKSDLTMDDFEDYYCEDCRENEEESTEETA